MHHVPPEVLGRENFRQELREGLNLMQDTVGDSVCFYRAPGFSWNSHCEWLPEELVAAVPANTIVNLDYTAHFSAEEV